MRGRPLAHARNDVYTRLGVRPVINADGSMTLWGGAALSPTVKRAMDEADSFVEMEELLEKSGERVAELLGVEAAYVTSGCFAALALSTAACMAGLDKDKIGRLPDPTGMKDQVLIQKRQRHAYDRALTASGATLVEVGTDEGCSADNLISAIGPKTVAVAYNLKSRLGAPYLSLEQVVEIAKERGLPSIADSAEQVFPVDYFVANARSADLVGFGGKYFGAPQSTGFVCGRKDLVEAVVAHGFIGFYDPEARSFGRGFKVDRQEIIGMVAALEEWLTIDHERRISGYERRLAAMGEELTGVPAVTETAVVRVDGYAGAALHVSFDPAVAGKDTGQAIAELNAGTPRVFMRSAGDAKLAIAAINLYEGDEVRLIERLADVLGGA